MANWCYSGIGAFFTKKEDAEKVCAELYNIRAEADKENKGMDLGMGDNWLFDVQESPLVDGHHLSIAGEVRWGFALGQMQGLCKWFFDRGATEVTCDYEEISNHILGEWVASKEGMVIDTYLPTDSPIWDAYHKGDADTSELEEEDKSIRHWPLKGELKDDTSRTDA